MGPTNYEKMRNAETMYGTGSPQHRKMLQKLCGCECSSGGRCYGCAHAGCGNR